MSKKLTFLVISIILFSLIPIEMTSGSDIDLSLPLGFESISPSQSSVIYDDHFDLKGRLKDNFQAKLVKFKGEPVEIVDNGFEIKDIRLKDGVNTFLIDMTDINGKRRLVSYTVRSEKKKLNLGGGSLVETVAFNSGLTAEGYSEPGPRRKVLTAVTTSYTPPQYQSNASQYTASSADVVFTSPYFDQVITENKLKIGGRFNKDAGISSITVNGQSCTLDKADGTFEGPTLVSPGEARRKKINSDSAEYIIMKVNPENHSGKNELKVVIKPEDGKAYEDRVEYYYYQMFVMTHIFGTDVYDLEDGFQMSTPYQTIQSYNKDLFGEPPFGSWPYPEKGYRYDIPLNKPGLYYYNDDSIPYYFAENYPELYYYSGLETYRGHGSIKTSITLHSPPVDNKPFVVVLKNCSFLEDLPFFPRYTISSISGYKVNGMELAQLGPEPRTSYVVLDNVKPDTDFGISVDTPYYAEGFRIYRGYIDKHFAAEFHEGLTGDILIDSNNDGFLGGDDNACEMISPGCVFWVNDDDDYDESKVHPDDNNSNLASGECDTYDDRINGIRDLEDFMPINITVANIKEWANNQNVKFYLKTEGKGKIRVFKRVNDAFLTDLRYSKKQFIEKEKFLLPSDSDTKKKGELLDSSWFDSDGKFYGTFEGVEEGDLKIILEVELINGNTSRKIVLDEAIITLKNISEMYRLYNVRTGPTTTQFDDIPRFRNKEIEVGHGNIYPDNPDVILIWTHGYNNTYDVSVRSLNTIYKRLYRSGFRGGFIGVVWKAHKWPNDLMSTIDFNADWVVSYQTGQVFADIITDTIAQFPDSKINVGAHSLGNNIMCYALRLLSNSEGEIIDNVILAEAAIPGEVFTGNPQNLRFNQRNNRYYGFFGNMYGPSISVVKKNIYNTFSTVDRALTDAYEANDVVRSFPTPLDLVYKLVKSEWDYKQCMLEYGYQALGSNAARSKYTKLFNDTFYPPGKIMNVDKDYRPYGIRSHSSMMNEYYYDVQEYFMFLKDPEKYYYKEKK